MYLPHRKVYWGLLILITACILIPCVLTVGFISTLMTEALMEAGDPGGGMLFELQLLSAFSMVFGTWVIFSLLFFSSDRELLVTLPIPDRLLLLSKFLYSYLAESAMEFFILAAVFAGFFIGRMGYVEGPLITPLQIIACVSGVFLVPLIPMIYAALYSMILMALLKNVRSANTFFSLTTVLMCAFIGLFLFSLRGLKEINMDNYIETLGSGGDVFLHTLNVIFFPVPWLCRAISDSSLLHLLLYLVINAVFMLLLYGCGHTIYREGLYTAGALGSSKKLCAKPSDFRARSPFFACVLKELRVLLRTRAFANNCVYVNLILPAMAFGLFYFMKDKGNLAAFITLYQSGKDRAALILTVVILSLAFLATALNSIASTAFTREGAHLSLMNYIPVPLSVQLLAKAFASFIITYPVLFVTNLIIFSYVGVSPEMQVYYQFMTLLAHLISVATGMSLDSVAPYVMWEDEYSALRGNINTFFNMGAMMLICGIITLISYLLYEVLKAPMDMYYAFLFFMFLGLTVLSVSLGSWRMYENRQGEKS